MRLPKAEWEQRHRWIMRLLWVHVPIIIVFAVLTGNGVLHGVLESLPTAAMGYLGSRGGIDRRSRAMLTGLGLMFASAVLVHLSGGLTEVHFHFFVMLGVISLYQDWQPFLLSIAFVALHHGVMGYIRPKDVFDTPAAWNSPVKFAAIHAFFVLCAAAVSIASWGIVEAGHRRSRAQLEASEHRFRALIEHAADVVTVLDADGTITYDSPSCTTVLGYASGARVGTSGFVFVHDDDRDRAERVVAQVAASPGSAAAFELRVKHFDGTYRWVEGSIANLLDETEVNGFVINFRDITDRKFLEEQLAHQAFHDPLTGLANRALLLDRIDHALATRHRDPKHQIALLFLDLDDFKTVNDGLGHEAGDELLREAAARLSANLRPGDTASRLGGDEFAVLLEGLPERDLAYEIGARVLESLQAPFDANGEGVCINASIGIAVSVGNEDAAALLRNADLAMYRAKGQGKGRFEIYEAGMHAMVVDRMALKADMRRALAAAEFEPHYQPIVDLETGRMTGVEALVRWNHPERGLVAPAEFIPMAEETGLIIPIGSHVLHQACADAAHWQLELGERAPRSMSVNLSPRQIQDQGVVDDVELALSQSGLSPSALTLEITESFLLEDTESAARTLAGLKGLGVRIALDDFGTGYSSLTHLDRFPVDVLKIDKSFVDALDTDDTERSSLVSAIVNLGMMLGLHVTAEGIEGAGQLASLRSMGCELGQGYLFAKPMTASTLLDTMQRNGVTLTR
ncbi:MAG TPA: EAL domain-containing protein [Acidimicrobiales bacterium]|nr:EAL domain-containing protein [Acidimicrobiales bacterium]